VFCFLISLLLLLLQLSAPELVYKLDLATQAWPPPPPQQQQQGIHSPAAAAAAASVPVPSCKRPRSVLLYTLCSPGGCYTDWHVDFGGSAVWYHMVQVRAVDDYTCFNMNLDSILDSICGQCSDWHVGFGGSAVWYHMVQVGVAVGKHVFALHIAMLLQGCDVRCRLHMQLACECMQRI
jgi:hypothetical protein